MKITRKLLHIPPYLTTSWSQIKALSMKEGNLVVILTDNRQIDIPNIDEATLNSIFIAYANFLETDTTSNLNYLNQTLMQSESITGPIKSMGRFHFNALDPTGSSIQHNPMESDTPEFPREVLEKIAAIAKIVAPEDIGTFPTAEPHCNCPHCQIARAIHEGATHGDMIVHPENIEPIVPEEIMEEKELVSLEWNIKQMGENLYDVTNRLDPITTYHVFLGTPVGCTCGKSGCEHILAVLKS